MLTPVTGTAVGRANPIGGPTTKLHPQGPTSSSSSSHFNLPLSANSTKLLESSSFVTGGRENNSPSASSSNYDYYYYEDSVIGQAPSRTEVERAISDLQKWVLDHYDPRLRQSQGIRTVDDAVRSVQTDPSLLKMIISISSDKTVWDAILNNRSVQNFRRSLYPLASRAIEDSRPRNTSNGETDLAQLLLNRILDITKTMILELIEKFKSLVDDLYPRPKKEKLAMENTNEVNDKIKSSLSLSIVIILIVIVTRVNMV